MRKNENILINTILVATGWSIEQKQQLLAALQRHGATDPFVIASEIPGRTVTDVQLMIKKYERLALQKMDVARSCKAPLDQWIETIQWTAKQPLNISCISKALKYIALFEPHEPSLINLPDSYELLADLSSGISGKHVTNETAFFLRKCLYQLSVKVKNDNTDEEEEFLETFKPEKLEFKKTYGKRKATDPDPLMNPLLNNLVVPRTLLKKSTDVVLEETEGITTNKQIPVKKIKKNVQ